MSIVNYDLVHVCIIKKGKQEVTLQKCPFYKTAPRVNVERLGIRDISALI